MAREGPKLKPPVRTAAPVCKPIFVSLLPHIEIFPRVRALKLPQDFSFKVTIQFHIVLFVFNILSFFL